MLSLHALSSLTLLLALQLIRPTAAATPPSINKAPASGAKYLGCYKSTDDAHYYGSYTKVAALTSDSCLASCKKLGYKYAGLKAGNQCLCDDLIPTTVSATKESACNAPCAGKAGQSCGGPQAVLFYQQMTFIPATTISKTPNATLVGCYAEPSPKRALPGKIYVWAKNMTVQACVNQCHSLGFTLAGVEWAQECHCGSAIANQAVIAAPSASPINAGCNMRCAGNTSQYCGGEEHLNIYSIAVPTSTPKSGKPAVKPKPVTYGKRHL